MRARGMAQVSSVLLVFLAAAGCGRIHAGQADRSGTVVRASVQAPAALPEGYGPIMSLAGDGEGSGAWFWDFTTTVVSVFHVDGQGVLKSWPVLSGAAYQSQLVSGFAVTAVGVVWLGINSTLIRLDSNSGAVRTWQIPAPSDNPAAESYLPPPLKGQHLVQGIAVASDGGEVAIAMSHSSSVEIFDQSDETFSQVSLPASSDAPVAVAYAQDGSLGIGMADYKTHLQNAALIIEAGGAGSAAVVQVADSSSVTGYGKSSFIIGSTHPDMVSTAEVAAPVAVPTVPLNPPQSGTAFTVMPDGYLAAIIKSGVIEFDGNAATVADATAGSVKLTLPAQVCGPGIIAGEDSPEPAPPGPCLTDFNAMTVDSAGGVWVVPANNSSSVERIST
jgi:hypothetical protein